jgi:hypothetical protein
MGANRKAAKHVKPIKITYNQISSVPDLDTDLLNLKVFRSPGVRYYLNPHPRPTPDSSINKQKI